MSNLRCEYGTKQSLNVVDLICSSNTFVLVDKYI